MRKQYKRTAYLLDDDILLEGYVDKYGFHPLTSIPYGFSLQKINKHDIGKTLFYTQIVAIDIGLETVKIKSSKNLYKIIINSDLPIEIQVADELKKILSRNKAVIIGVIEQPNGIFEKTKSLLNNYHIVKTEILQSRI